MTETEMYIGLKMLGALTLCMGYLIYEYRKAGQPVKPPIQLDKYRKALVRRMWSKRSVPYTCPHHALDLALGQMAVLEPNKCDVCKIKPDKSC